MLWLPSLLDQLNWARKKLGMPQLLTQPMFDVLADRMGITGQVVGRLFGPDGNIISTHWSRNLIVNLGDTIIADILAGDTSGGSGVGAFHGMNLGTGFTAVAKGDTAMQTPDATSYQPNDATFPNDVDAGSGRTNTLRSQSTWAAGEVTVSGLDETGLWTNGTEGGASSGTMIARAELTPVINKGANDTYVQTWDLTFAGT